MAEPLTPLSYQYLSPQVQGVLQSAPNPNPFAVNFASSYQDRTVPQVQFSPLSNYQPMSYSLGASVPPPSIPTTAPAPRVDYSQGTTYGASGAPSLGQAAGTSASLLGKITGTASSILGPVGMLAGIAGSAFSIYQSYQANKAAKEAAKKQEEAQLRYEAEDKKRYNDSMSLTLRQQRNAESAAASEERRINAAAGIANIQAQENVKNTRYNRQRAKQQDAISAMANAMTMIINNNNSVQNRLANSQMWRR